MRRVLPASTEGLLEVLLVELVPAGGVEIE